MDKNTLGKLIAEWLFMLHWGITNSQHMMRRYSERGKFSRKDGLLEIVIVERLGHLYFSFF